MANIQNDIFENQEFAYNTNKYLVTKQGEITCTSINSEIVTINGESTVAFTQEDKDKLTTIQSAMQLKGKVETKQDLPTDAQVGDVYLVGAEGSEEFEEYVCVEVVDNEAVYESLGTASVSVSYSSAIPVGTVLGTITIDGVAKTIYAPVINDGKLTVKMDGETRATFTANNVDNVVADLKSSYIINTVTTSGAVNAAAQSMTVFTADSIERIVCQTSATATHRCNEWAFTFTADMTSIEIVMSTGDAIQWAEGTDLTKFDLGATYVGSVFGDADMGYFGVIRKFE